MQEETGDLALPLILQGVQRHSILFSNVAMFAYISSLVQGMEAAIAFHGSVYFLQVGREPLTAAGDRTYTPPAWEWGKSLSDHVRPVHQPMHRGLCITS